jgi:two-component system chemotaxis response regulator CheY
MQAKVFIADDAAFVREVLSQILSKHGFEVVGEAQNGIEAVEMILKNRPDLVIMDIVMPVKSGIQATEEILKVDPTIPIIACSTEGSEAMVTRAIASGCVDFVEKPFQIDKLIATIKSVLDKVTQKVHGGENG